MGRPVKQPRVGAPDRRACPDAALATLAAALRFRRDYYGTHRRVPTPPTLLGWSMIPADYDVQVRATRRAGTTAAPRGSAPTDARPAGPAPAPLVRPPATSRAAHARPDSRTVMASPRGPPHRSPNKRVLSGCLAPA